MPKDRELWVEINNMPTQTLVCTAEEVLRHAEYNSDGYTDMNSDICGKYNQYGRLSQKQEDALRTHLAANKGLWY